jgi:hypothetical protein
MRRLILYLVPTIGVVGAVVFGIILAISASGDEQHNSTSPTLERLHAVTPTVEEHQLAKRAMHSGMGRRVGLTEASLESAYEIATSTEAGRMVFFAGSSGGCLIMSGNYAGSACGDTRDKALPVLSMFTSIDSSPYLVGGGIAQSDVVSVTFKDSEGRETRFPVVERVFKVVTSDRLTRDAKYAGADTH